MEQQRGHGSRAVELLRRAVAANPAAGVFHFNLGVALEAGGQLEEAAASWERALRLQPNLAEARAKLGPACIQLGEVLWAQGRLEQALTMCRRAIELQPQSAQAQVNLGNVLQAMGRLQDAEGSYRLALAADPNFAIAHANLGTILKALGRLDEARESCETAVALDPGFAEAHTNLGAVLQDQGHVEAAIAHYRRAVELNPKGPEAYSNLGGALESAGSLTEAEACCRRAIELKPGWAEPRFNLAVTLLLRGDFEAGLKEHEARWGCATFGRRPDLQGPAWSGEDPSGKSVLLYPEQGLGDVIQFARFGPLVRARGARVIIGAPPELTALLRESGLADDVFGPAEPFRYDLHAPLMSVPYLTGATLDTLPPAPYLRVDPARVPQWQARLGLAREFRVGIAWAGSPTNKTNRRRSMALAALAPLGSVPGVRLFSL